VVSCEVEGMSVVLENKHDRQRREERPSYMDLGSHLGIYLYTPRRATPPIPLLSKLNIQDLS